VTVALIELGDLGADPASPPPSRPGHRLSHRIGAALVVLLCLATLTYSIPPTSHDLRVQWSLTGSITSYFTIVGDSVILTGGPMGQTLTSYAIADGADRWTHSLSGEVPYINATRDSGVLLVPTNAPTVADSPAQGYYSDTIAVDATTGVELWRLPGSGDGWASTGTALLEERSPNGARTARLRVVRLADGSTVWSREAPEVDRWITLGTDAGHPDRVALIERSGAVRILRLADGTQVGSGSVQWEGSEPARNTYGDMFAEGDHLYVVEAGLERVKVTAYSQSSLRRLWQIDQPSAGGGAYPCGPVLCVTNQHKLTGYDWTTGAARWRVDGQESAMELGAGLLLTQTQDPAANQVVLDAATGRRLAELGGTAAQPWVFDGNTLIALGSSPSAPGRTVVSKVDLRTGETFPLGTIDLVGDPGCQLAGRLLVCGHPQGRLTVTAVG